MQVMYWGADFFVSDYDILFTEAKARTTWNSPESSDANQPFEISELQIPNSFPFNSFPFNSFPKSITGGWPSPLKNDGVKVSWDDEIPNISQMLHV